MRAHHNNATCRSVPASSPARPSIHYLLEDWLNARIATQKLARAAHGAKMRAAAYKRWRPKEEIYRE